MGAKMNVKKDANIVALWNWTIVPGLALYCSPQLEKKFTAKYDSKSCKF